MNGLKRLKTPILHQERVTSMVGRRKELNLLIPLPSSLRVPFRAGKYFCRWHVLGKVVHVHEPCYLAMQSFKCIEIVLAVHDPLSLETIMPYVADGIMTLKFRLKAKCLGKKLHFLMRLKLLAKFFVIYVNA